MADITEVAKNVYASFTNIDVEVLGQEWDTDDIKGLLKYDVLRIVAIFYIFSNLEERKKIIRGEEELFGFNEAGKVTEAIIDDIEEKKLISELFRKLPFSVGLFFEYDQKKLDSNLSYTFAEMLQVLILGICCPDGKFPVNAKTYMFSAYMETLKNHLLASGIKESNTFTNTLPGYQEMCLLYDEVVPAYVEIENCENGKRIYDLLNAALTEKRIEKYVKRSEGICIDATYTQSEFLYVTEETQNLEMKARMYDYFRSCLDSFRNTEANGSGDNRDECGENYEKKADDDENYTSYGEGIDIDKLWEKLYESEDKINNKYGEDCFLVICNVDTEEEKKFKHGTMLYCLEMAREYAHEIQDSEVFIIRYGEEEWKTTRAFRNFGDGISGIWSMTKNIPDPIDNRIIPATYTSFSSTEVDDINFETLWEELQRIEAKYRKGINYENRYDITDWESELCFEQGKLLENVVWVGKKIDIIPETAIPYCTYSKMEYEQLKYYLYWRTCFRNGEIIVTGYRTFYYLCVYELLVDFGPYTPVQRLTQLEKLYKNFKREGLTNAGWVEEYASLHNLEIQDEEVNTWASWGTNRAYSEERILEVINGNYSHAFEIMMRKSAWKLNQSAFIKKVNCIKNIGEVVTMVLPKLEALFHEAGIVLSDFLVGKMKKTKIRQIPYSGSVWNECVLEKLSVSGIETEGYIMEFPSGKIYITDADGNICRKSNTCMHYCDPYLSEYIIKYTEMLFRMEIGYGYITMPEKLTGALKMKFADGYSYVLSANQKLQEEEKKYIALYNEISEIIEQDVKEYSSLNGEIIASLKTQFTKTYRPSNTVIAEKKTPVDELMNKFISNADDSDGQVEKLIGIYNQASLSMKKTKAKRLSNWIWDFWILHENEIQYSYLEEQVINNRWNYSAKKAIIENDYRAALPYFNSVYNLPGGIVSRSINSSLIEDCIILTFLGLNKLFSANGVDLTEVLLGKWGEYVWEPYSTEETIKNTCKKTIVKNIADLEIYQFDATSGKSTVNKYLYGESSEKFITYVLKKIDNRLRAFIGHKSMVSADYDISELFDFSGYEKASLKVDELIVEMVRFVVGYNKAKDSETKKSYEINVLNNSARKYGFESCEREISDIKSFAKDVACDYYGLEKNYSIVEEPPYDVITIDFSDSDINKLYEKYPADKATIHHTFANLSMYRFYEIFDDVLDRFYDVESHLPVEYNPDFDFVASKVMNSINGLSGKDLGTLTSLVSESNDFGQWLAWIEHGKIVVPKNLPYVQLLFHFAMNRLIFENEPEKCLVVLCEIWNYFFDAPNKMDQSSNLYLEWIKDYWLVYCPNMEYEDLKKLLRFYVIFDNENNHKYAKDHYLVDISTLNPNNLLSFYNANCDYHVLEGLVVSKGYREVFEKAIEAVHIALSALWKKYGFNFEDYLHYEDREIQEKEREIFFRGILTSKTKRYLRNIFEGREVSYSEDYLTGYDYEKKWPVLIYEQYEISNNSSRVLMDYIIKHTEKVIRDHLGLIHNFKLDDKKVFELFPNKLFMDNLQSQIIIKTIEITTELVCGQCGI